MPKDIWDDRRRALEEDYFARRDRELIDKIQTEEAQKKARADLSEKTGIQNEEVLQLIVRAEVTADAISALKLAPLVVVAWADGALVREEKEAVFKAAKEMSLEEDAPAYEQVEAWLSDRPPEELFEAWRGYIRELKSHVDSETYFELQNDTLARVREVAESAGGHLGFLGRKTSDIEKVEITRIEEAFKN